MAQTSINFQAVKAGSEEHNKREKELNYVHQELTPNNEYWENDTQTNRLQELKKLVKLKSGRKMQKNASPIWEAVVVIEEGTTMADLKKLANELHEHFGMNPFQIAIHRDEGYMKSKDQMKLNLHAHMVFDWIDHETGKAIHYNRTDMARIQTLVADVLHMERGKHSDKKHLNAMQFKAEKAKQEVEQAKRLLFDMANELWEDDDGEMAYSEEEYQEMSFQDVVQSWKEDISEIKGEVEDQKITADYLQRVTEERRERLEDLENREEELKERLQETLKKTEKAKIELSNALKEAKAVSDTTNEKKRLISQGNEQLKQIQEGIDIAKSFDHRISKVWTENTKNSLWGVYAYEKVEEEIDDIKNSIAEKRKQIESIIAGAANCVADCINRKRTSFSNREVQTIEIALGKSRREEKAEAILEQAEEYAGVEHEHYIGWAAIERSLMSIARGEQGRTIEERGHGLGY